MARRRKLDPQQLEALLADAGISDEQKQAVLAANERSEPKDPAPQPPPRGHGAPTEGRIRVPTL